MFFHYLALVMDVSNALDLSPQMKNEKGDGYTYRDRKRQGRCRRIVSRGCPPLFVTSDCWHQFRSLSFKVKIYCPMNLSGSASPI
jgi:hypothetical protein